MTEHKQSKLTIAVERLSVRSTSGEDDCKDDVLEV